MLAGVALTVLVLLKMLGHIGPPTITLIGLAIFTLCYLSLAATQKRATRLRPLLTVLFGLIHGFGFASVLMQIGLPTDRLVPTLLGFNIGVEIGQLGIVAALWIVGTYRDSENCLCRSLLGPHEKTSRRTLFYRPIYLRVPTVRKRVAGLCSGGSTGQDSAAGS